MSLANQIDRTQDAIHRYEHAIKEAREKLWEEGFEAKHDARRKGESDQHWHKRRRKNRTQFENREKVVKHLVHKKEAHEKLLKHLRDHRQEIKEERAEERRDGGYDKGSTKIVTFDGKPVVEDAAYWLYKARHAGWGGVLVSGYRTPQYSQSLCYGMCGAPSCPGRCAGLSSNHTKTSYPGPAVDVTDYWKCEEVLIDIGSGYKCNLPYDPVHMSKSGA